MGNDMVKKCMFWGLMIEELLEDYIWIPSRDFNMVEHHSNKTNECGKVIIDEEIFLWEEVNNSLNVMEHLR
jgi:hypothetical protein